MSTRSIPRICSIFRRKAFLKPAGSECYKHRVCGERQKLPDRFTDGRTDHRCRLSLERFDGFAEGGFFVLPTECPRLRIRKETHGAVTENRGAFDRTLSVGRTGSGCGAQIARPPEMIRQGVTSCCFATRTNELSALSGFNPHGLGDENIPLREDWVTRLLRMRPHAPYMGGPDPAEAGLSRSAGQEAAVCFPSQGCLPRHGTAASCCCAMRTTSSGC